MGSLTLKRISAVVAAAAIGAAAVAFVSPKAGADHEPANKLAAAGSATEVFGPGETVAILEERIRVNTSHELILQLTAECDILTDLAVGGSHGNEAGAFGQVRTWIELDGTPVKVSSDDDDSGAVVLCNRAHEKSVQDAENDTDGTDEETDMTNTRQANGFNWLALDVGRVYDDSVIKNGNNIIDVVVYAEFTETATNNSHAEARVGHRTLIVEPDNASVHESVDAAE